MAKANFSKIEGALEKGLQDIQVGRLLKLTEKPSKMPEGVTDKTEYTPKQNIILIQKDLKLLVKQDSGIYQKLKLKKQEIKDLAAKVNNTSAKLSEEEKQRINAIRELIAKSKEELIATKMPETQVEAERVKHVNKRINVNEKWLPLDVPRL